MNHNYSKSICLLSAWLLSNTIQAEVPPGYYYPADGLSKQELKTALHHIISKAKMLGYGSGEGKTWQGFFQTDQQTDGSVLDRYSSEKRFFNNFESVEGMHIEHSFPKSWWGSYENNAYRDLFHLYPGDGTTNMTKGNLPLGIVALPASFDNGVSRIGKNCFGDDYKASCFEPADAYKGDFARSYLYLVTAYEDYYSWWNSPMLQNDTYPVFNPWSVDLLLDWHRQDPVDEIELLRQGKIYNIQGNRNPFIDYPLLAEHIWGNDTLNSFHFPIGSKPFLISPTCWTSIDMGVSMISDPKNQTVVFEGKNFSTDLSLSLSQGSNFTLSHSSLTPQQIDEGTDVLITFSAGIEGYSFDTLVVSNAESETNLFIPLCGLAASDFILTGSDTQNATSARLNWIQVPDANHYLIDVYQGDQQAGDLVISEYIEGSSWNKALELYNGTGKSIDLTSYSLRKQSNGAGSFSAEYKLSGILENNTTLLLCSTSAIEELKSKADVILSQESSVINFNGNDAIALYRNNIRIDIVGEEGNPAMWGEDCTFTRNKNITHPSSTIDWSQWSKHPKDFFEDAANHTMDLSVFSDYIISGVNTGGNNHYTATELSPEQLYTYHVTLVKNDGSLIPSVNTMQIKTKPLVSPEIGLFTEIDDNSFTAHWDAVAEATHYLVDLFQLTGNGAQYTEENFDQVSNGKPLPSGWTGNASGSYSSSNNSGKNPNSIGLKGNEWLQTPVFDGLIDNLSFMYSFTSTQNATGSYFTVDGLGGNIWRNIDTIRYANTSRYFPVYKLASEYNAIKFTYANKAGSANLALDDIGINYGKYDTIFIHKQTSVSSDSYQFSGLNPNSTYFFRACAAYQSYHSRMSEPVSITTQSTVSIDHTSIPTLKYTIVNQGIMLSNTIPGSIISIYDLNGILISRKIADAESILVPITQKGIFIAKEKNHQINRTIRIVL